MSENDYAVVVGIGQYPNLAADGLAALRGPVTDAAAVHDWLVDPDGGAVPAENVTLILQTTLDPQDPQPTRGTVETWLQRLESLTRTRPGRRLYLYFAGHGFAPVLEEGAVFTAEASQVFPVYVYAYDWLRWFRRAQRFGEYVLWMDCCMNWQQSIPVAELQARPRLGTGRPGPTFLGLAAQTKSALEYPMADGSVHGVFTWTLLQGLRGGAADEFGRVTGESLASFLYAVMPEYLPADARETASVDLHPFVRADHDLVFRDLGTAPTFRVRLGVPSAAAGQQLTVWTGRPLYPVVSLALQGPQWEGRLPRGLYVVEVEGAGLRQGFAVTGGSEELAVDVTTTGPAVDRRSVPGGTVELTVVADNPAAAVAVVDHRFDRILTGTGELQRHVPPGIYQVRTQFGRDITLRSDDVILVDRDTRHSSAEGATSPRLTSPAPVEGTGVADAVHQHAFETSALGAEVRPRLSVVGRFPAPASATAREAFPHPLAGLSVVQPQGRPVDLWSVSPPAAGSDAAPVAVWEGPVAPGACRLRQTLANGQVFEATVTAVPGWLTQVVVQRADVRAGGSPGTGVPAVMGDAAIFMRREGAGLSGSFDEVVEAARLAMVQGRDAFADGRGERLRTLLLRDCEDPIGTMIGCHLLLRTLESERSSADQTSFDEAVVRLRSMVGTDHPDVEALSLRCAAPELRATTPFPTPPVFALGWRLVVEASYARPDLLTLALWQRVHASTTFSGFFAYAVDDATRRAHADQLERWLSEHRPDAENLPDAARRAVLPAVALKEPARPPAPSPRR